MQKFSSEWDVDQWVCGFRSTKGPNFIALLLEGCSALMQVEQSRPYRPVLKREIVSALSLRNTIPRAQISMRGIRRQPFCHTAPPRTGQRLLHDLLEERLDPKLEANNSVASSYSDLGVDPGVCTEGAIMT